MIVFKKFLHPCCKISHSSSIDYISIMVIHGNTELCTPVDKGEKWWIFWKSIPSFLITNTPAGNLWKVFAEFKFYIFAKILFLVVIIWFEKIILK